MFLGRSAEINYLNQRYQRTGSQLVVVYGQKHVGRTTVIKEFSRNHPMLFLCSRSCSGREQRYLWARECEKKHLIEEKYPSYYDLFYQIAKGYEKLSNVHNTTSTKNKVVLVIDEFQNLIKTDPQFMEQLVRFIKDQGTVQNLFVVLSSSSVGFVENSLISKIGTEAALAISGFLKIKELSFEYLRDNFEQYDLQNCLKLYSVIGGFPGLWKSIDVTISVKENFIRCFLNYDSIFLHEVLSFVTDDLRETNVYFTLLETLASGKHKLNDLYLHTEYSRAKISVYLKNLMELELVEKVFSFDTDGKENVKKGIYRIKNPLVRFYFHYIFPSLSSLRVEEPEEFYSENIEPTFRFFIESSMKKMCMEYLQKLSDDGNLPIQIAKSGEWVGKIGTIDIVLQDQDKNTVLALCNYEKREMTMDDYDWLLFLAKKAHLNPQYIYLFSIGHFEDDLKKKSDEDSSLFLVSFEKE